MRSKALENLKNADFVDPVYITRNLPGGEEMGSSVILKFDRKLPGLLKALAREMDEAGIREMSPDIPSAAIDARVIDMDVPPDDPSALRKVDPKTGQRLMDGGAEAIDFSPSIEAAGNYLVLHFEDSDDFTLAARCHIGFSELEKAVQTERQGPRP